MFLNATNCNILKSAEYTFLQSLNNITQVFQEVQFFALCNPMENLGKWILDMVSESMGYLENYTCNIDNFWYALS